MSNLCLNHITLTGPEPVLERLLTQAAQPQVPFTPQATSPNEAEAEAPPTPSALTPSAFSLERLDPTPLLLREDGQSGWCQWRVDDWGTKWDLIEVQVARSLQSATVTALSAWNPPLEALRSFSGRYPQLGVCIHYEGQVWGSPGRPRSKRGECLAQAKWEMTES